MFNMLLLFVLSLHCTSSQYLNETLILNLDLTVYRDPSLSITSSNMHTAISAAFIETNVANQIYDTAAPLKTISDYHYINEDDNFEYAAAINVYFQSSNDYDRAINDGYGQLTSVSLPAFVAEFESNLYTKLYLELLVPNAAYLEQVSVNSMKIIQLDVGDNTGTALVKYNTDVLTLPPTTASPSAAPTAPTASPTASDDNAPFTTIINLIQQNANTANYTFDEESSYWILLVFFLLIGCCCGCCGWHIVCVKFGMSSTVESWIANKRKPATDPPDNKQQTKVQMEKQSTNAKKKKPAKRKESSSTYTDTEGKEEEEERRKQRDEEEDSEERAKRIFSKPVKKPKPKKRKEPVVTSGGDESDDDSVDQLVSRDAEHRKEMNFSDSSEDSKRNKPKTRRKNKKTGNVEPERYDIDGNRILSTKELMQQYKKNRQNKVSISVSYKVGGEKKRKTGRGEADDDDSESESDSDDKETHHPHYKAEPSRPSQRKAKLNKVRENKPEKGSKRKAAVSRKKAARGHKRSTTMNTEELNLSKKKKKHQRTESGGIGTSKYRPGSASGRPSSQRPQSATTQRKGKRNSAKKGKTNTKRRSAEQDDEEGSDDGEMEMRGTGTGKYAEAENDQDETESDSEY